MKTVSLKTLKDELSHQSPKELMDLCIALTKFKKENKELLSYLLFEANNEEAYIERIKEEMDALFEQINTKSFFYVRKSVRKILTNTKKYIRYSQKKETEVVLLLYFCEKLIAFKPSIAKSPRLQNTLERQILLIKKALSTLHEDLQYDYQAAIEQLENY